MNLDWLHPSHPSCVFRSLRGPQHHGEQPSARCTVRPQVLCRMWGEDCRPLSALLHGALLAYALPQVLLLPSPAGGHRYHLLQQRGHDSLSERLHQVRARGRRERKLLIFRCHADLTKTKSLFLCLQTVWAQRGVQCLQPVNSSQRNGDEGTGKCLPPQGKSPALTLLCFISRSLFDRSI